MMQKLLEFRVVMWAQKVKLFCSVVLPTFILERRSLLEMYSDFFAHADFFSAIPQLPTERERMIAVIRWYLTSFHAGRNGSVAKKVKYKDAVFLIGTKLLYKI